METIILEKRDGLAWVTLNRPQVLNAYNVQMRDEVYEALGLIAADPEILVGVFKGAGSRAFCAGADLTEFGSAPSQAVARKVRFQRDVWARFLKMEKPFIAAIHGFCLGSGLEIALCCDLRIATPDARFGLPETGLGMVPAAAGTQTFPRAVGGARGLHALLTAETWDAQQALKSGLITRLTSKESLYEEAGAIGLRLAALDQPALRLAKQAVLRGRDTTLERGLRIEANAARRLAALRG